KAVELSKEEPVVFTLYVQYLYTGSIPLREVAEKHTKNGMEAGAEEGEASDHESIPTCCAVSLYVF
ncbi:hypothetical protein K504DRAFT_383922, partial [Pleomassaria siparia CBS 279.74]